MPRHPPNAQKNKQQKTHEHNQEQNTHQQAPALSNQFAEIITVRCSRPLYSSQPTHPHPPKTPEQPGAPDGSGNQGALPQNPDSMPPPHHAGAPTTTQPGSSGRVFYTKHQATNQPHTTVHDSTVTRPSARASTPAGPDPSTARTTNDQEATPTQIPILRKEVIQPHLPVRLPCYDFVPITSPTFDRSP